MNKKAELRFAWIFTAVLFGAILLFLLFTLTRPVTGSNATVFRGVAALLTVVVILTITGVILQWQRRAKKLRHIKQYIVDNKDDHTELQVREALVKAGWSTSLIHQAFRELQPLIFAQEPRKEDEKAYTSAAEPRNL